MRAFSFPSTLVLVCLCSLVLSAPRATAQSEAGAPLLAQDTVLSAPAPQAGQERVEQSLARLRIPFIANESRIDRRFSYYASTFAGAVYVTRDGTIVYSLRAPGKSASAEDPSTRRSGWSLTETLVGGKARPHGDGLTPTRASYFIGNDPTHWKTDLATYDSVSLGEVWPGVDVRLRAYGRTMEKLFTVRPGAKPSQIRVRMAGARSLQVNGAGALVATTGLGEVTFTPPAAYQERGGTRREIDVAYEVRGNHYGFRLNGYDSTLPVVIDPLLQATYLGGSGDDSASAIAIDPVSGRVYVAGSTASTDFPGTAGGAQPGYSGNSSAFVACLSADLTVLHQATYLGGGDEYFGEVLAIHPASGDVYMAGHTNIHFDDWYSVHGHAFVARLSADLTVLRQVTILGGPIHNEYYIWDRAHALAIDPLSGDVFVAGDTSDDLWVYVFVARLNADLTVLKSGTYFGGDDYTSAEALAIHPTSGEVYVAGMCMSFYFPGTTGGAQPETGLKKDGFVARLNADLTTLDQATYLGGSGDDSANALAVDPVSGRVYVAGPTTSTDFPGTTGGAHPASDGSGDAFVARLNSDLTVLDQSTYLGGSGYEGGAALAIHPTSGEVYVAGPTTSTDFPGTTGGAQPDHAGGGDAFVARLNSDLTVLDQSTYLGGSGYEDGAALAIHPTSGEVYVAGPTTSTDFSGTTGGAQPDHAGGGDAFVARLSSDLSGPDVEKPTTKITLAPATPRGSNGWYVSSVHATVTATGAGGSGVAEMRCVLDPTSPPAIFSDIPAGCAFVDAGADVSSEGVHMLYAASKDVAGNLETPVSAAFYIDKTPPTVTCGPTPVFFMGGMGGSVSASVTDATSGPAVSPISASATGDDVATPGTKSKSLTGLDHAGNSTTVGCPYVVEVVPSGQVFNCTAGDVPCLIAAIDAANANPDADTINLAAGIYTLTAVNNQIDGENGLPSITSSLDIRGVGSGATVIERDPGGPNFRIIQVGEAGTLTLESLTIRNGAGGGIFNKGTTTIVDGVIANNGGGGIRNERTLILRGSRVEDNNAYSSLGGGIFNTGNGTVIVDHSSISRNTAFRSATQGGGAAGGILNFGTVTITYSTIADNGAGAVGGIWNWAILNVRSSVIVGNFVDAPEAPEYATGAGGVQSEQGASTTIENSTIARNYSNGLTWAAGGITNIGGSLLISNSTIVDNQANKIYLLFYPGTDGGGGLFNARSTVEFGDYGCCGTVQLQNTILARNQAFRYPDGEPIPGADCGAGEVTSLGNNLVGDPSGCGITLLASDLTGDPGLDAGQDDGTPGNSHYPLLETSQAVDAGDSTSCILIDQLGHSRIDGDGDGIVICDIGASEFSPAATIVGDLTSQAPAETAFRGTPVPGGPAGSFTITATFTNTSSTSIHDPVFKVTQLSDGNLLLNADGGPGSVGASLSADVGADRILASGESFTTRFVVGLQHRSQFTFFVDLWGVAGP